MRLGQYVTNGSQLFFLLPNARWIVANFKEAQAARMQLGQRAWFTVDALEHQKSYGKVERVSPAAGSEFSILRPDNATGNFTKVPQHIPVRIIIDPGQAGIERLRTGMSVEAFLDTQNYVALDDIGRSGPTMVVETTEPFLDLTDQTFV